jgi:ABC-type molybdate transport system substrate-binding protein
LDGSGSKDGEGAKALIAFLTSHAVTQALTASGFEPRRVTGRK